MSNAIVLGIDLTSTAAKASACLALDDELQVIYFGFLFEDSDILAVASFYLPEVIAVDAPLSLSVSPEKGRVCERQLSAQGIPCYFTTEKSIIRTMVYRGIALKDRLTARGFRVIEVYPYASKVSLFGKTIPAKTTAKGMGFLKERLQTLLPGLGPHLDMFDHHLCDAAIAAYTGLLYRRNLVHALGNHTDGLMFIPRQEAAIKQEPA